MARPLRDCEIRVTRHAAQRARVRCLPGWPSTASAVREVRLAVREWIEANPGARLDRTRVTIPCREGKVTVIREGDRVVVITALHRNMGSTGLLGRMGRGRRV